MQNAEVIAALTALAHLDADAYFAYTHAVAHAHAPTVRAHMIEMRDEHQLHVERLGKAIVDLGGEAPKLSRDVKGLLLEGMAVLRSITGTRGAILAMSSIEDITARAYAEALALSLPTGAHTLCESHFADEVAHRAFLHEALHDRPVHHPKAGAATGASSLT